MIIEIVKGSIPFLTIFLTFVITLSYTVMALRDDKFIDSW
jgi:hypothetical protein